jgi:2-polyprenyl-3-methyl-5-hydroxy-6-metoxy-1,4-benzoquinol methylase
MSSFSLMSRFFVNWDGLLNRITIVFQAIQQGFWLGLLSNKQLDEIGVLQYAKWSQYVDENYNLSGLQHWEKLVLNQYFQLDSRVVLAAAGGGREAIALARMGYIVDAFDSTPSLALSCKFLVEKLGLAVRVFTIGSGDVPKELTSYAGIIVGWGGYMHIPGARNRVAFLRSLRKHVETGAPLLVSFFHRSDRTKRHTLITPIASVIRRLRGSKEGIEYGDALDGTFDHHFTESEIRRELAEGGFQLSQYYTKPYGHAVAHAV